MIKGLELHQVLTLYQGEHKDILICDISDQKTKYVLASKDTQVVNLNPNLQQQLGNQPI